MRTLPIEKIMLKGFQSHVDSTICVSPGLTVVTGPSDSGKTAIIRAIRWVAFGEPAGDSFVNQSVGQAEVNIHLANGTIVTKRRKGTKTSYMLEVPGSEPMIFDKAETPEEIIQALGIVKTQFGDFETELNFAYQLAAPFLLSEPPSAGAKVLGKLSGTEVVDMAIKAVAKDNYAANQQRLQAEKDIKKTEDALTLFVDLPQQQEQLQACGILLDRVDLSAAKHKTFTELQAAHSSTAERIAGHNETLQRFINVHKLREDVKGIDSRFSTLEVLQGVLKKYKDNRQQIAGWQEGLKQYESLPTINATLIKADTNNEKLSIIRHLVGLHKFCSQEIRVNQSMLNITDNLPTAVESMARTEAAITRLQSLRNLQLGYLDSASSISRYEALIESTAGVPAASGKLQKASSNLERLQQLQLIKIQHNFACSQSTRYVKVVNNTANVLQVAETLRAVDNQQAALRALKKLQETYKTRNAEVQALASRLKVARDSIALAQNELHEMWKTIDVCPLCNSILTGGVSECSH